MKRTFIAVLLAAALVLSLSLLMAVPVVAELLPSSVTWYVDPSGTDDGAHGGTTGSGAFKTIQYAVNTAASGNIINVAGGTYAGTLDLKNKPLTLAGAGIDITTIDAHASTGYAVQNFGNSTTISGLTLIGTGASTSSYGFKISHVSNITFTNVKVENSYKTAFDLNTVTNATLTNIQADSTNSGFGLMILDSQNINVNNITTSVNAWGGVSVQTKAGITNAVTFTGSFNAAENLPLLLEKDPPTYYSLTNVQIPGKFGYAVYTFRSPDNYQQTYYQVTLGDARTLAASFKGSPAYSKIAVFNTAENNYFVDAGFSIQDAVDHATAGDIINIAAGTYDEQVIIHKSLTLQGAGDTTVIKPSGIDKLALFTNPGGFDYYSGMKIYSIIVVDNVGTPGVTIKNLKVDGDNINTLPGGVDDNSGWLEGIKYHQTAGLIQNVTLTNFRTAGGVTRTHGIDVNASGTPVTVEITGCRISNWQRNGIIANGIDGNLTVNIHDNTLTGPGPVGPDNVPNGVVLMTDVGGTIIHNTISACHYNVDLSWRSVGIMMFDICTAGVVIENNEVFDVDDGINVSNDAIIRNNNLHNNGTGIVLEVSSAYNQQITGNTITNNTQGIQLNGAQNPNPEGQDPPGTGNVAHFNNIYGNSFGVMNYDHTQTFNAENNWWGDASGPEDDAGVINGLGDKISTYVNATPWIKAETAETKSETVSGSGQMDNTSTGGTVLIIADGDHTITTAVYADNPGGTPSFRATGTYYDVNLDNTVGVDSLVIDFCPAAEGEEIYFWDGAAWRACSNQVNTGGCIRVTITALTFPSLSDLAGLPFASGTAYPIPTVKPTPTPKPGEDTVGGEVYPVNKIKLLAPWLIIALITAIGVSILVLRRRTIR